MYIQPTIGDFKARFFRDFPYTSDGDYTGVTNLDINNALSQQQSTINQCLFNDQNLYSQGALLLSAHYMVQNLRASSQGIAGKFEWLNTSKSVGAVSSNFEIPPRILENPELAILTSTVYGTQFLYLVLPLLTGQMFSVKGATAGRVNGIFSGPFGAVGPWDGTPV